MATDLISEILKGSEYFYCEKLNCRLKIDVCLQRQQANLRPRRFDPIPFLSCENCSQGAKNLRLRKNTSNMPQEKPLKAHNALTIEYFNYVSIFNEIKRLTENENKQIDLELIYLLRTYFRFKKRYRPLLKKYFSDFNEHLMWKLQLPQGE